MWKRGRVSRSTHDAVTLAGKGCRRGRAGRPSADNGYFELTHLVGHGQ